MPSGVSECREEDDILVKPCRFNKSNTKCETHGGRLKSIKVTSKKWAWLPSKKSYGYKYGKVTKYVCERKNIPLSSDVLTRNVRPESESMNTLLEVALGDSFSGESINSGQVDGVTVIKEGLVKTDVGLS